MANKFSFTAPIDSKPFKRGFSNKFVLAVNKDFREALALIAANKMKRANQDIFNSAVEVEIIIGRRIQPTAQSFGDVDNHQKNIFDALNKIVWRDDRLITKITCQKIFAVQPFIKISVSEAIV